MLHWHWSELTKPKALFTIETFRNHFKHLFSFLFLRCLLWKVKKINTSTNGIDRLIGFRLYFERKSTLNIEVCHYHLVLMHKSKSYSLLSTSMVLMIKVKRGVNRLWLRNLVCIRLRTGIISTLKPPPPHHRNWNVEHCEQIDKMPENCPIRAVVGLGIFFFLSFSRFFEKMKKNNKTFDEKLCSWMQREKAKIQQLE